MIEVLYSPPASMEGPGSPFTREEHAMREPSLARGNKRTPRRSQTQHEYFLPVPPTSSTRHVGPQPQIPEGVPQTTPQPAKEAAGAPEQQLEVVERSRAPARRPPLGPPRRSYSTTDQKPIPRRHRPPQGRLALADLPPELHYAIFDFLDPIDSTCFGLTSKHFYAIHRRLHGSVPLTARRAGPNNLEWAWHLAGNIVRNNPTAAASVPAAITDGSTTTTTVTTTTPTPLHQNLGEQERRALLSSLSSLRVRGQGYCRICGITRCQLHKHVQEWMGPGWEYCSVRERFGPVAPEGSKAYCYMSRPGDRKRCGRHGRGRGDTVELR